MKDMIDETAIIRDNVLIGINPEIREFVTLGSQPMIIKKYKIVRPEYGIMIGNDFFINTNSTVLKGSIRDTKIGNKVFIGQNSTIGHDSIIGDKVIIVNHCVLNGFVEIGKGSFIGSHVVIRERIKIGKWCFIGQGSNVLKDIPDNTLAYGNPCRPIKQNISLLKRIIKEIVL